MCGAKKSQADVASAARAGDEPAFRSATCAEEVRNMLLQDACLLPETAGHLGVHWRDAWPRAARGDAGAATPKCGCSYLDDSTVAFRNAFEAIADAIVAELLLPQLFVLALPAKSGDVSGLSRGQEGMSMGRARLPGTNLNWSSLGQPDAQTRAFTARVSDDCLGQIFDCFPDEMKRQPRWGRTRCKVTGFEFGTGRRRSSPGHRNSPCIRTGR